MDIVDLDPADGAARTRCAELLVEGFRTFAPDAWPDLSSALEEVDECLQLGPVRVAVDGPALVGWVGCRPSYAHVWELHPLIVDPVRQREGIGQMLVADVESIAAARGAMTMTLGSDDETGLTTLAGVDLYPDPVAKLARIEDAGGHPFVFYMKCGYAISGVTPDANGFGKPDIHLSKRVGSLAD